MVKAAKISKVKLDDFYSGKNLEFWPWIKTLLKNGFISVPSREQFSWQFQILVLYTRLSSIWIVSTLRGCLIVNCMLLSSIVPAPQQQASSDFLPSASGGERGNRYADPRVTWPSAAYSRSRSLKCLWNILYTYILKSMFILHSTLCVFVLIFFPPRCWVKSMFLKDPL